MFSNHYPTPGWLRSLKPFLYCSIFLLMLLPIISWQWFEGHKMNVYVLFLTPAFLFILTPMMDFLLGRDQINPTDYESRTLSMMPYYRLLPILCAPTYAALLCWSTYIFTTMDWGFLAQIAWLFSIGTLGGMVAINVAHELIHKNSNLERFCGGFLLSMVCYPGFKIEHIRHHHVIRINTELIKISRDFDVGIFVFFMSMTLNKPLAFFLGKIHRKFA